LFQKRFENILQLKGLIKSSIAGAQSSKRIQAEISGQIIDQMSFVRFFLDSIVVGVVLGP